MDVEILQNELVQRSLALQLCEQEKHEAIDAIISACSRAIEDAKRQLAEVERQRDEAVAQAELARDEAVALAEEMAKRDWLVVEKAHAAVCLAAAEVRKTRASHDTDRLVWERRRRALAARLGDAC